MSAPVELSRDVQPEPQQVAAGGAAQPAVGPLTTEAVRRLQEVMQELHDLELLAGVER